MNGDLNELLTEIKAWSKQIHEQRHKENLSKFDKLFDLVRDLPCKGHIEKFKSVETRISWLYLVFIVVVIGGIVLGLWIKAISG